MSKIIVLGGSGYVGSCIISRLAKDQNNSIVVFTRQKNTQVDTKQFDFVEFKTYPETDEEILHQVKGTDIIINLIGTMDGNHKRATKAHVEYPQRFAEAAKECNVQHFIHLSALGAAEKPRSVYFDTKWQGENVVKDSLRYSKTKVSIVRPSFIFGKRAPSIDMLTRFINKCPMIMLPGANGKFQPVHVDDVAQAIINILETQTEQNATYELVGSDSMTLIEMIKIVLTSASLCSKKVIKMPNMLSYLLALTTGWIPKAPFTMNQYHSLKVDSISKTNDLEKLGITPKSFQSVISFEYKYGLQDRYEGDRMIARRNVSDLV